MNYKSQMLPIKNSLTADRYLRDLMVYIFVTLGLSMMRIYEIIHFAKEISLRQKCIRFLHKK